MIDKVKLKQFIGEQIERNNYSGVIRIEKNNSVLAEIANGFANQSDKTPNNLKTRFGIASGCKIFTAIAIVQLIENNELTFDTKVKELLNIDFSGWDDSVSVLHLLTHSSGLPDYFDEEEMDDYEKLWQDLPVYKMKRPENFLPLFQNKQMKFRPGERFSYNNAGYILLGLIIEGITNIPFIRYIEEKILKPALMKDSGYFSMNELPERTAYGYITDEKRKILRTNFFSIPIIGGPDGGAFCTAADIGKFWCAFTDFKLISRENTESLVIPHKHYKEDFYYGVGVWLAKKRDLVYKYFIMGNDPGINFNSTYYPEKNISLTFMNNVANEGFFPVLKATRVFLEKKLGY